MMLTGLGYLTLALAFLLAVYGLLTVVWGLVQKAPAWTESARLALLLIFPLVTISLIVMIVLLLGNRFDVSFVYSVISRDMPGYLKVTALWGGQSGSLLFWSWLLAGFSLVFSIRKWGESEADLLPWVLLVVFFTLGFFLSLNLFYEIPFERFWHLPDGERVLAVFQPPGAWLLEPVDGQGLNPLLRHPGMIWHPPALYLGFVGFIVPFALAIATLAVNRTDHRWLEISRPWMLITWVFLSLGLVLGMRWAYDILGWGGYWGWDPVEIAALMPWLSGTAFLHTGIFQRKQAVMKRWNLVLALLTFMLVIFGTFITRSGVLSSVHSFAESEIGEPMFFYLAIATLGPLVLLLFRWDAFRSLRESEFEFSREALTLFSNLVLLSILAICFLGVIYPIISELLTNNQITVGPAWYKRITGPLFLLLLLLMGVCPLAAWRGTNLARLQKRLSVLGPLSLSVPLLAWGLAEVRSVHALFALWLAGLAGLVILAEFVHAAQQTSQKPQRNRLAGFWSQIRRNHRQYGGLMVHLGIVLMSLGIIGIEGMQQEKQVTLSIGEAINVGGYQFNFEAIENFDGGEALSITEAVLAVTRNGKPAGALYPQRQVYLNMGMAITQPGIRSSLAKDIYAILIDWHPVTEEQATFRIYINPLVNWLWIGTGVLTLGTITAGWPDQKGR